MTMFGATPNPEGQKLIAPAYLNTAEFYRQLLVGFGEPLLVVENGTIVAVTRELAALFGYAPEELPGLELEILVPDEAKERHSQLVSQFISAHGNRRIMTNRLDLEGVRKDGSRIPVNIAIFAITIDGRDLGVAVIQDVTEAHKDQAELESAQEALQEAIGKQALQEEMASWAARMFTHDSRNILHLFKIYLDLIGKAELLTPDGRQNIATMHQLLGELSRLCLDFQSMTELRRGIEVHREEVDVMAFLVEKIAPFQEAARQKEITLSPRFSFEEEMDALFDPHHIGQVLNNLISNAIKYSPLKSTVIVHCRVENSNLIVELIDRGPGLSTADQARLFRPFARLSPQPTAGEASTGLGLYIAREIARCCGGEITVKSELGSGSTFALTVPLKPKSAE